MKSTITKANSFRSSAIATYNKKMKFLLECVSNRTAAIEGGCVRADVTPGSEVISHMGKVQAARVSPNFPFWMDPLTVQQQLINIWHKCMVDKMKGLVGDLLVSIDHRSIQSLKETLQHRARLLSQLQCRHVHGKCYTKVGPGVCLRQID